MNIKNTIIKALGGSTKDEVDMIAAHHTSKSFKAGQQDAARWMLDKGLLDKSLHTLGDEGSVMNCDLTGRKLALIGNKARVEGCLIKNYEIAPWCNFYFNGNAFVDGADDFYEKTGVDAWGLYGKQKYDLEA